MATSEKLKKMSAFMDKMNKTYGANTLVTGNKIKSVEFYSTGNSIIDSVLGGGIAKGRMFSVYGEYSCGKTTIALQTIATNMKKDPDFTALYLDQESALDVKYAQALGCDMDRLIVMDACEAEVGCNAIREAIREGAFNIVVIDSTNALAPQVELGKDVAGNSSIGATAKLLSVFCRQIIGPMNKTGTSLICIEQVRDKVGAMVMPGMPTPVTIGSGKAVGFYCSQRLELKKGKPLKEGSGDNEVQIGNTVKVKAVKNKVSKPNLKGEVVVCYGKGFDAELADSMFLMESGTIERVNARKYSYTDITGKVHEIVGKDNVIPYLKDNGLFQEALDRAKGIFVNQKTTEGSESYTIEDVDGSQKNVVIADEEVTATQALED